MVREELRAHGWLLPAARNKVKLDLLRPLSKQAAAVLPTGNAKFVFQKRTGAGAVPRGNLASYLVAGRHRYEGAKQLKWESIPAIVLEGITADDAELAEIDGLIRANRAEEAAHHARRQVLYEKRNPETKRAAAGGAAAKAKSRKAKPQKADKPSYSEDAAARVQKVHTNHCSD
jgi:ParB-like nuclease domain